MVRSHLALRRRRSAGSALFAALLVASALPASSAAIDGQPAQRGAALVERSGGGTPDAPGGASAAPGPSIAYQQAMEHEQDRIAFVPGGRVTVGFAPRADDRWQVDGKGPVALPAGRATGRQLAAAAQGSVWASIDRSGPGGDPGAGGEVDPGGPAASTAPADAPPADGANPSPGSVVASPSPAATATPDPAAGAAEGVSWVSPAAAGRAAGPDQAAASGLRRQVFGFLPYWELSGASGKLNYGVLSTIAYFSVGADGKGNLRKKNADGTRTTGWAGWTSSSLTSVINDAHARGTRVVLTISVFAWTSSQAGVQRSLLGSSTARLNLARQAAAAVRDRGADGVNLDFEPLASGYESEFVALLKTFRTELNRIKSGYQLTYDTTGYIGNYPLESSVASGAADAIFIMGYDYRTAGSSRAGSIDPLSGPGYDLADTVRLYTARVSPSKVILGLPWYGRAWSTVSDDVRAKTQTGAKYGYSTAVNYENVTDLVAKYGRRWDSVEQSSYLAYRRQNCTSTYGCVTSWRQVYYDDGASMKPRLALVNDYGLRGAGLWALGYDGGHAELYRAISESFLVDKSAPQAGVRVLAGTQPDEGFIVTWSARDVSAIASYDVQVSTDGGAWTDWLRATKATSDVFLGRDGHGYAFRVRARDAKGNTGGWIVTQTWDASPDLKAGGFGRVRKDGLSYRAGPDTSSAVLGSLDAGTIVALTRGPVSADGYTWYEVTQPIKEWSPVSFVERGVWIATASGTSSYVTAYRAPNSTKVDAGLVGLDFGAGGSAVGTAAAAVDARTFSPNGDDSRDGLRLRWTGTTTMESLALNVYRVDGTLAGSVKVHALASGSRAWTWDGKVAGTRVKDGRYILQLAGSAAGKTYRAPSARPATAAQIAAYGVTVDTVAPVPTSAAASAALLSPNGDGRFDSVRLTMASTGSTRWTLSVAAADGTTVRSAGGSGTAASFTWKGTDDTGTRVPDGRYTATISAWDVAGNHASRAFPITVDTKAPAITQTVSRRAFSPNGDGTSDTTRLGWTASEPSTGTARLYRGTTLVRSWSISRQATWSATWNGKTASGATLGDGTYVFKVSLRDAAGNRRVVSTKVVVDRTGGWLRWSGNLYPQDTDSLAATARLGWTLKRTATTTLRLYDADGNLVRTVWAGKSQAAGDKAWTWNGRLANGSFAPQGLYTARLTVASSLSKQELVRSVWAAAFSVRLSAAKVVPGQTLTVTFTTVEKLSTRPTVTFTQPGRAGVRVTATKLADGSYRASFRVAAGAAGGGTLKLSAKDSAGRVNTMVVAVQVAS